MPPAQTNNTKNPAAPRIDVEPAVSTSITPDVARGLSAAVARAVSKTELPQASPEIPSVSATRSLSAYLLRRQNMVHRTAERWRPPLFTADVTPIARVVAALRRCLDLQAGSIYRDLKAELARPHGLVLDVGCGAQPYRSLIHPQDRYLGIDIAASRDYFGYDVPDTIYYDGDTWPVTDASVDTILCTETLEHVRDPGAFLAEAARVAKPGATLLITVPFSARWHFIPHDYWRYTPSSLKNLLEAHGFSDVAVFARGNEITVACYKWMALILPLIMPTGKTPIAAALLRLIGLLFSPLLLILAVVANLSLLGRGGDDCLGYTAVAIGGKSKRVYNSSREQSP